MAALPYMRLYAADYLADTAHLSAQQHGIYLLLILNYWQRGGPLPNDDARLAKIARVSMRDWKRSRDEIADFFTVVESHWRHSRIDTELAHVAAKSLKSKGAAQASVQRRFGERSTDVEPTDTDTDTEVTSAKADSPSGDEHSLKPEEVFEGYQALAGKLGLAVPRDLTPERRQLIRGRISQYTLDDFQAVFARCRGSPFLRGDRKDGRTPLTIDWVMKKGNFQKVLEGNYDD